MFASQEEKTHGRRGKCSQRVCTFTSMLTWEDVSPGSHEFDWKIMKTTTKEQHMDKLRLLVVMGYCYSTDLLLLWFLQILHLYKRLREKSLHLSCAA